VYVIPLRNEKEDLDFAVDAFTSVARELGYLTIECCIYVEGFP